MNTECTGVQLQFQGLGRRRVEAGFDGGHISSDGGALLLREVEARLGVVSGLAGCFTDYRDPSQTEHSVEELLRQRIFGIALGYEDLNDWDDLARDPLLALALDKQDVEGQGRRRERDKGKALASRSTLNRLELTPAQAQPAQQKHRYRKITHRPQQIEALLVTLFLDSFEQAPEEMILDFDATDDPVHGQQEGRFFHGYYRNYCYLPLYVFCGEQLLVAKLRTSNRDAADGSTQVLEYLVTRIRERFPHTRIIVRADSGFARNRIMSWCEENKVFYLLGLAKNERLLKRIGSELVQAKELYQQTQQASRVFTHFHWSTRKSWTRERRVIAKAEHLSKGTNPRFIVTNLPSDYKSPQALYEQMYCARGDMENRIKEQQLDLFSDRTSTKTLVANQLRLWFSSLAYVLLSRMRKVALQGTELAKATCGTIRLKLLKIGAQVRVSVRRISIHFASACPSQHLFAAALHSLQRLPLRT